jgi:SAM-dependent methyltransferase
VWADERRALGAVLDPVAGRTVLDAGCGDGRWSLALGDQGAQVVGVDGDAVMLQAARRRCGRGRGRPILVRADVAALPFANGAFDLVTAVTVLCVAARPLAVVRELARVVRVGGQVVVGELGRWSLWAAGRRLRGWVRGGPWRPTRFWTVGALRGLLRAAGLVPGPVRAAVFYPRRARAARVMGGLDARLGRLTTLGAAFIAVAGRKPDRSPSAP